MTEILKKINESGLSPNQYFLLYAWLNKLEVSNFNIEDELKVLESLGHINDGKVTSTLFDKELEERGFHEKAVRFAQIFPPLHLPGTRIHMRGKIVPIKTKLAAFIRNYSYDWDTIYEATERYVRAYEERKYAYMQTASTFIYDKNGDSTLALECDTLEYMNRNADNESI